MELSDCEDRLAEFLDRHRRLFVLTGAGCSTESGIPDYRDAEGAWKHKKPMEYKEFVGDEAMRRRYWSRSMRGWRRIAEAAPNRAHRALADLEARGRVRLLVTQNVDGLHQKAGSRQVVDLHGRLDRVECLGCRVTFPRADFQRELERRNPDWVADADLLLSAERARPDGDVDLAAELERREASFDVPACPSCGGVLKPWVVFFGESVPRPRVHAAFEALDSSDGVLVVGSSLMVFSGYRFIREAARRGIPVCALNLGRTRAEDLIELKIGAPCGDALPAAVGRLAA